MSNGGAILTTKIGKREAAAKTLPKREDETRSVLQNCKRARGKCKPIRWRGISFFYKMIVTIHNGSVISKRMIPIPWYGSQKIIRRAIRTDEMRFMEIDSERKLKGELQ